MSKLHANTHAFTFVAVLLGLLVFISIGTVGWHLHANKPPPVPMDGPGIHVGPRAWSNTPKPPAGDLGNSYTFEGQAMPNLSARYNLLNQYRALGSGAHEADYITALSPVQVHTEAIANCNAHKFKFEPNPNNSLITKCFSRAGEWTFTIKSASGLIDQPWYSGIKQIDEPVLAKSVWLQVLAGSRVID